MWGTYNLLTFKIIIQCCYYLCTCRSVVVEFYPWFKFCYPLFETHYHTLPYSKTKVKLISNRWAWALLPTKLVGWRNALAWGGSIHGNPASGPYQTLSHWAIQWNTYQPILTWPIPQEGGREGWEKTKAQNGMQTAIYCNTTLRRTASKQLHIQVMRCPR